MTKEQLHKFYNIGIDAATTLSAYNAWFDKNRDGFDEHCWYIHGMINAMQATLMMFKDQLDGAIKDGHISEENGFTFGSSSTGPAGGLN